MAKVKVERGGIKSVKITLNEEEAIKLHAILGRMTHGTLEDIWTELDDAFDGEENPYYLINSFDDKTVSGLTLRRVCGCDG